MVALVVVTWVEAGYSGAGYAWLLFESRIERLTDFIPIPIWIRVMGK